MNMSIVRQVSQSPALDHQIELSRGHLALVLAIALGIALVAFAAFLVLRGFLDLRARPASSSTQIFVVLSVLVFGVLWITQYLVLKVRFTDYALPFLLIGGIVTFLVAISLVVVVFKQLGLTSATAALGLPEGSIRAFIALSLILLFFIIAVFLYLDLARPRFETLRGLSEDERDRIMAERPESVVAIRIDDQATPPKFDIKLTSGGGQTAQDVAKQTLTTVITLVVAIASFYFGSTAVAQAQRTTEALKPASLRIVDPKVFPVSISGTQDSFDPVKITLVTTPADEPVRWEIEGDDTGEMETLGGGVFTYKPGAPQESVKLTVTLMNFPEIGQVLHLAAASSTQAQSNSEATDTDGEF